MTNASVEKNRRRSACLALVVAAIGDAGPEIVESRSLFAGYDGPGPLIYLGVAAVVAVAGWRFMPLLAAATGALFLFGAFADASFADRLGGYLLGGVLPSAVTAVPVALWSGRPLTQVSLTTAAVLWLITGGLAYRAARRHDFAAHRDWMLRNYALTFLAVNARVVVPLFLLARAPFDAGGTVAENAAAMIPIGQTVGWILNLTAVEVYLRRRRRRRISGRVSNRPPAVRRVGEQAP
ncbi:DUF2306 domain-containing protein [Actinoplanes sp. NPDC049802]|uniref:DUF2306 domain-containing protein n=1 Tax=Actinoplanes sp. NPDC049802 TaxID=3154742 RepID=UPI0034033DC5